MLSYGTILLAIITCTSGLTLDKLAVQLEFKHGNGNNEVSNPEGLQILVGEQRNRDWGVNIQVREGLPVEVQRKPETLTVTTNEQDTEPETVKGYRRLKGHNYYKLVKEPGKSWHDAREVCQKDGGDLAVIDSQEEADFLVKLFCKNRSKIDRYVHEGYVGVSDEDEEGTFVTIDGTEVGTMCYNKWMPGEPNNGGGERGYEENCVTFHKNEGFNDVDCGRSMPFFCEVAAPNLSKSFNITGDVLETA